MGAKDSKPKRPKKSKMATHSPVSPPALILVTGVNGNMASSITLRLLEKGYSVRGTVRRLPSASHAKKQFEKYGSKFEVVEVGDDITKEGVFNDALAGVDAVIHTASPVTMDATRPEQQYDPAIKGTLSIMRSAHNVPSVKRFLYLGSMGSAVMGPQDPTKQVVTRDNWNIMTPEAVKNLDDPAIGFHIYIGSKIEGERAAWKFADEEKPQFSVTTILAAVAFGPIPSALTAPPRQDQSLGQAYDCFADPPRVPGLNPVASTVWVHSLDVADLFVQSLSSPKTVGKRLMADAGIMSWVQVADIMRKKYPDRPYPPASEDAPRMNYPGADVIKFDTALEEELLGGKWRTLEQATLDCAKDLLEKEKRGWDKL
ncbi:Glycine-rich RNA-binding protein 2, mitochondrial [Marasmius tenuissimus]|uniref:Glycine-rich RNA-binding protein 2, mitochondrial n=1 Tax=Marasmius tenuissimus TaxID=585030 RepID=A0ABR2ZZU1_9AGAR